MMLFATVLASELLLGATWLGGALSPRLRCWPPSGARAFGYWWVLSLTAVSLVGTFRVALSDWNSFALTHWSRFALGGVVLGAGAAFALWGVRSLGVSVSSGLPGQLHTKGAYRWSRHPQYVGTYAVLIGFGVLSNSRFGIVLCLVGVVAFLAAPLAEEAALRRQFGTAYEEYARHVPRFLGRNRRSPS